MFKYITSFHSELPQREPKVVKAVLPKDRVVEDIVIEPWIRKALDRQILAKRGAEYARKNA